MEATERHQRPPISDGACILTPQVTNPAEWAIAAIVGGTEVDAGTSAKTREAGERATAEQRASAEISTAEGHLNLDPRQEPSEPGLRAEAAPLKRQPEAARAACQVGAEDKLPQVSPPLSHSPNKKPVCEE